jgi:uncharacterized protein (DUF433 family)
MRSEPAKIPAFTAEETAKLTGLTCRQLQYWNATGVFRGEYETGESHWTAIYSFCDLVRLDTLAQLRKKHGVPLRELRKVGAWLRDQTRRQTPWPALRVFIRGKRVYFQEPGSPQVSRLPAGQPMALMDLGIVVREVTKRVERLRQRGLEQIGKIQRQRRVAHNAPVIAGTRIPTVAISQLHQAGYTHGRILKEFPTLTRSDVEAAVAYEDEQRSARRTG